MSPRELALLDAAIVKRVTEAEAKITAKADAKLERETKAIATKTEATVRSVTSKVDAQLTRAIDRIEKLAPGASPDELRELRQRLETLEGATSGVARAAPLLPLLPHPALRLGALAIGARLGALEGSTREERRQRAMRAAELESDHGAELDERLDHARDLLERLNAARRRARGGAR